VKTAWFSLFFLVTRAESIRDDGILVGRRHAAQRKNCKQTETKSNGKQRASGV